MTVCEDAPCCGCCGPAVWAAEARSQEGAALDYWDSPEAWRAEAAAEAEYEAQVEQAVEDGTCCELGDSSGHVANTVDFYGWTVEILERACDYCGGRLAPSVWVYAPEWADRYGPYRHVVLALWGGAWRGLAF